MLDTKLQELAVSLGFRLEESKVYIYTEGHLEYNISKHTISILDKTNKDIETYPTTKENILKVINVSETIEEIAPLDLSLSEDGDVVSSEVKNRALVKMNDEFMSQPFTIDDCNILGFKPFDDGVGLSWGSLTFMFRQLDIRLFVLHQGLSIKLLENPTRKQVDKTYHFFTGEHLDFSPKQKVYNWENCFGGNGYILDNYGNIKGVSNQSNDGHSENVYPTKEDAESALAHCQLLHIVNRINGDYPKDKGLTASTFIYYNTTKGILDSGYNPLHDNTLKLRSKAGAKVLIRDNKELLKTYFKIK